MQKTQAVFLHNQGLETQKMLSRVDDFADVCYNILK
jgi:hypothetical protein